MRTLKRELFWWGVGLFMVAVPVTEALIISRMSP